MSSPFKYPSQTAPVKIVPVKRAGQTCKPAKREKGQKRRETRGERRGERGERRERERERMCVCEESLASRRKPFPSRGDARREMEGREGLSSLFSATEFVSDARESESESEREREREREIEIEKGRGETKIARERLFFLSLLATEFPSRERERGEERDG